MNEVLFNYSSLQKRDTKIYAIGGTGIPGGISVTFLKVVAPVTILFILVGTLLSFLFGINMFNPFAPKWNWVWLVVWIVVGIIAGLAMWNVQFAGYRLYQYLIAYLKPKKVYTNNPNARERNFKLTNIKMKSLVKQII